MGNELTFGIRKILSDQGLDFDGSDDDLTTALATLERPELFERFPSFKVDWDAIRESRSPGTIGGIVNTAKSAFDRSVQAKNVLGGIGETDAGDIAERERAIQDRPSSPAWEDWQTAKGKEAVKVFLRDPIEIVSNIVVSGFAGSLPALAGGLSAGAAGSLAGPVGGIIGAAVGTGTGSLATEFGNKFLETLREAGADLTDPDSILRVVSDPEVRARASEMGLRRGLPVAVFDAASAGLAGKFLKGVRTASAAQNIRRGAAEAALQGFTGGLGEVAGAVSAGERISPGAVFEEIVGELGPGAVEVGGAALRRRMAGGEPTPFAPRPTASQVPIAPQVAPQPAEIAPPTAIVSPERRVSLMSSEQMAARLAELSAATNLGPAEQQELELLRAFVGTVETEVTPLPVVVPPEPTTSPAVAPEPEIQNQLLAPAPVSPLVEAPVVAPEPLPAPAPAPIADVTPNTEAFAGAAPVVEAVIEPPSAPAPVETAITPAPLMVAEAGAVAPEAPTTLGDQIVKIQARRAKTQELVEVEMPAVKAEKMLSSHASTLRKLMDCLSA